MADYLVKIIYKLRCRVRISKILTALILGSFLLLVNCHSYKINKNKIEKSSNVIDCLSMHYCMVSGSIAIDFFCVFCCPVVYPCPLFSVRFREPLFGPVNNSIMRLLVVRLVTCFNYSFLSYCFLFSSFDVF